MKNKLKIYLDTSVISALFDDRNPERKSLTEDFFKMSGEFDFYISEVTVAELNLTPDIKLKEKMQNLTKNIPILKLSNDDEELAAVYVLKNAIPSDYSEDALHIASAVLNNMDYLVSWNFKHIVKLKTKNIVKMINTLKKYKNIEIITPAEILD
jgi:predicted nucleic acid-binding protein